jgi:hypothetical protein
MGVGSGKLAVGGVRDGSGEVVVGSGVRAPQAVRSNKRRRQQGDTIPYLMKNLQKVPAR